MKKLINITAALMMCASPALALSEVTEAAVAAPDTLTATARADSLAADSAVVAIETSEIVAEVPAAEIPQFEREIEMSTFIPKGQWITGVSVSYSQSSQDNYQFLIVENLNGDTYSFKVSPMVMYTFNHNFSAMAAFRYYLSLGAGTRFGMFAEMQAEFGGGESKIEKGSGVDFTGTFEKSWNINVGMAPGLVMFLNNYSAIEVNVGVLGFNYSHARSTTDRIYVADRKFKMANFRINLFSITFGCTFYI